MRDCNFKLPSYINGSGPEWYLDIKIAADFLYYQKTKEKIVTQMKNKFQK